MPLSGLKPYLSAHRTDQGESRRTMIVVENCNVVHCIASCQLGLSGLHVTLGPALVASRLKTDQYRRPAALLSSSRQLKPAQKHVLELSHH